MSTGQTIIIAAFVLYLAVLAYFTRN